jgi:hypothetical protein
LILETQKLVNSHNKMLRNLGLLIYHRKDQKGGLDESELHDLLRIASIEEMEKEYRKAYERGVEEGITGE